MYGVEKHQVDLTVQVLQAMFSVTQLAVKSVVGLFLKKVLAQKFLLLKHNQGIYISGVLQVARTM